MNWLDWLIVGFVAVSIIGGWREGFIRLGIGFIALIVGFIAAAWFYGLAADPVLPYVKSKPLANFIGFQIIFFGVTITGAMVAALIARVFKLVGLSFVDRMLGAPRSLPRPVESSRLAPYIFAGSRILSSLTPYELKHGFNQTFDNVQGIIKGLRRPTLPVREE
jgi:membrane protein required for colicin V production